MKIAFSWDDGALEDQKLFELHAKYGLPGMFFVPTRNKEGRDVLTPEIIRKAPKEYISFGGHTENHTYLTSIPIEQVESEVVNNKKYLENILGHEVQDFCLPGGAYNSEIINIVYKHFKTIRTADTMNFRYFSGILKPAFHFYPRGNKSLFGNAVRSKNYVYAAYVMAHYRESYFDLLESMIKRELCNDNCVFVVWGHSWELEKFQLWEELEHFMKLDYVKNNVVEYSNIFK